MGTAAVHPCKCENAFQDRKYGKGKRVMNKTVFHGRVRCTSCASLHDLKGGDGKKNTNNNWSI